MLFIFNFFLVSRQVRHGKKNTMAGLSTLPENPGDSRFWTESPRVRSP